MPSKPRRTLKLSVKATKLGIRVRRVKNESRGDSYGDSWLVIVPSRVTGGKRIRKQFKSSESQKAVNFAEGAALTAKEAGQSGFQLTLEQLADAQRALKVLTPLGISLKEAAEEAVRHLRPAGGDITFAKLQERLLAEKAHKNRRPASLQSLRFYVRTVVKHFGEKTLVKATTPESLRQWIDSLQDTGMSARHLGNHVAVTKQFFRYALAHRFIGTDPTTLLEGPDIEVKPPAILSLAEVRSLLRATLEPAHRDLLPAVVLGLFCGLRSEELTRLRWEHVNLGDRKITISPEVGKHLRAQDCRYPEIPLGTVEFLLLHPKRQGAIVPKRFRARLTALHADAGFAKWRETHSNAKRHSFGSYACKLHGVDWVVDQMGNSVRMFVKHYKNASVTAKQAAEYFALTPANVGKVATPEPFPSAANRTA